ncbi:hypothetical protein [Gloeobacter kilaueensis]|uniref:SGNH/GDSL hydrolase family protein n=1 Tax=Gloeobacter kilaueensis (strain ATCC BAA-2537 / CCAP 1431/1 / ULC 316 / JS1) TaxID=1183438 RepID=U5QGF1_GLOK1|nr:hypothetical protein [Gloeobacter kilaueensis]AGY56714.1 hypothetical protein GKIL_0468 [Gloeobacter kilaueensis JS1]
MSATGTRTTPAPKVLPAAAGERLGRYFLAVALGLIGSCAAFLALVALQFGAPTESSRPIDQVYNFKSAPAAHGGARLVIVSGSNASFGVSCRQIQERTGVDCVNGGMHAGLATDYLLRRARRFLHSGDTVLLPLEYEMYTFDGQPNQVLIDYVFARDPGYFLAADPLTQFRFVAGISFKRLQAGLAARLKPPHEVGRDDYHARVLDRNGDRIDNARAKMTAKQLGKLAAIRPMTIADPLEGETPGLRSIRAFIDWCRERHIQVVATWPNTRRFALYQRADYRQFLGRIERFYRAQAVPVLGQPDEFMYELPLMYDSIYHLNDEGVRLRTSRLIALLHPYLSTPGDYPQ